MVSALFTEIGSVVTSFVSMLGDALSNITSVFYTYDATNGLQPTFLGTVAIISVGAGLVWLVYRLIKGAIRGIGK